MLISGLVRLTADAEMATTKNGKSMMKIKAVVNNGFGDNAKPCWIDASMFGDRGEKICQYMTKGSQVVLYADQVEPNAYTASNGEVKASLRMNVINVELVARSNDVPKPQAQQTQKPKQQAQQQDTSGGFADFNDDIPFMRLDSTFSI